MKSSRHSNRHVSVADNTSAPTTWVERKLMFLQAYKGECGVAYLLGVLGVFAPTTVALFIIDRPAYLAMGWSQSLLVVGAVGGMVTALLMCGLVIQAVAERRTPASAYERQRLMRDTLVCGSVMAMFAQFAGLTVALTSRMDIPSYAYTVLLIAVGYATAQGASALLTRARQKVLARIGR
ncbi:hypothetical protein QYG06_18005 [Xanthomonas euvesicatoria]|uniref:DUF2975 domain-containing protein n=3 Tax=Xanthomonas TaxID=338 RepID=A0AB73H310_9XANT|nr:MULTISPECIES: hypothetical protein [Xanthomonas]AOY69461.1 hypothetical protein BHE83_23080 [Xanthomonas euvesicatoria pv. vesicatoria str. 85-10]APO88747.1 hypothetical protein BJD11_00805 [Xanthomonas euvesicatoria]KHL62503.1 hypothetical protein XEU66b_06370 [Xanthomonas euvesicatoria]KLB38614.1 hypothetical protein XEUV206_19710 [Xanthomonas euvesicatoria]KLB43740.1 hypothetical protein XEUV259_20370 [Xanthomonas euvesicatoria]